jgi:hypothetical protein
MRTIRPSIALGGLIVISIVIAGCASGATSLSTVGNALPPGFSGGGAGAPAASAAPSAASGEDSGGDQVGRPVQAVDDAKIVRTGTIDLQVSDVARALDAARAGIRAMGGYIGASQTSNRNDSPVATVTYRVPVARWEDALTLLRGLSGLTTKVVDEPTQAVEVTGAIVDLQARIRNLRASETALQGIASRATKVSDVLEVQSQLTDVRGQIEQLTAQLTDLGDRASYATLTATYSVRVVAVDAAAKGWEPARVVDEASATLVDILQALTSAGIWFGIVWLPLLVALAVVVAIATVVLRRLGVISRGRREPAPIA